MVSWSKRPFCSTNSACTGGKRRPREKLHTIRSALSTNSLVFQLEERAFVNTGACCVAMGMRGSRKHRCSGNEESCQ